MSVQNQKKVAILQSNYIPWKGYFDLIAAADEFILFDDMQYTKRDWRNRNKIKTTNGLMWLSVPVNVKGRYHQTIRQTEIQGSEWVSKHLMSLKQNYSKTKFFSQIYPELERIVSLPENMMLSVLNRNLIEFVCAYLNIDTKISNSWDYDLGDGKTERLVDLCKQVNATEYISGPAAKGYIDESNFVQAGIKLSWFNYDGYSPYPQLWGDFVHGVSILDLLFNCGPESRDYMKFPGHSC